MEKGFLPVFSVDTEEEARKLLTRVCKLGYNGEYISSELASNRTIDNLIRFGQRLEAEYVKMKGQE